MIEIWHIWIIAALLLFIVEIFTTGFAVACFSVGALFASVAAAFDWDLKIQLLAFAVGTLLAFIFIRPIMLKFFQGKNARQTNADALINKTGRVVETIDNKAGTGRVVINGDNWKAISSNNEIINEGKIVTVLEINSIILTVKKNSHE